MRRLVVNGFAATVSAVLLVGCGASTPGSPSPSTPNSHTTTAADPTAQLNLAVRRALRANHRVAKLVLWRNAVPASASESTRGPALSALRSAAAGRRRRGVHVRVVFDGFRIESVTLDPSFTRATAIVVDPQRVRPYGVNGKPLGQPVRLSEKSRFELRRLGNTPRFVVWQVGPAR